MKKKIYVFSGLGADKRVFQKIEFGEYDPIFINWIKPIKNENLKEYCTRLIEQISEPKPTILGISIGGIVAQEIAKQIQVEKLILLATIERKQELPIYLKILGHLKIDKIIPARILKFHNFITDYIFGVNNRENSEILKKILFDTDKKFLKWSLRQIAEWKQNETIEIKNKITIHGTKDRILTMDKKKKYNFEVIGGGHFFTLTHEKEINEILKQELKN